VPKNQSTASKKARAAQATAGGKHTTHLRNATKCGTALDPWGAFPATCARAPHPVDEPHSEDRDFDVAAWRTWAAAENVKAQAVWDALSDEERAKQEHLAFEDEHDGGRTATDAWEDARAYKWED
jgi:hypothetical protein